MRPKIDDTWFGSITVEGERYEHDIIIRLSGKVRKRNKQLSKAVHGTSHTISLAEIKELHREQGGAADHRHRAGRPGAPVEGSCRVPGKARLRRSNSGRPRRLSNTGTKPRAKSWVCST